MAFFHDGAPLARQAAPVRRCVRYELRSLPRAESASLRELRQRRSFRKFTRFGTRLSPTRPPRSKEPVRRRIGFSPASEKRPHHPNAVETS